MSAFRGKADAFFMQPNMSANDPKRTLAQVDLGEKPAVAVREEIAGSVALLARRLPPARQSVVLT
jgi:hypothetical protein